MNYSEFLSKICKEMKKRYPKASVSIHTVLKNNDQRLDGLLILHPGENIIPTIYLNSCYLDYQQGAAFANIVEELATLYEEHRFSSSFDTSVFRDFDHIRNRVSFRLISRAFNSELLSDLPFVPFLDLAVVFFFPMEMEGYEEVENSSILIHTSHMKYWNTTPEELFSLAKTNTRSLFGCEIIPIEDLLFPNPKERQLLPSHTGKIFVLSNRPRSYGATCLLYEDVLASFAAVIQDDFYVLPSSVHEALLLPAKKSPPAKALLEMVEEVNQTEVLAEDLLSNHIYLYHAKEHRLGLVLSTSSQELHAKSDSLQETGFSCSKKEPAGS